MHNAGEPDSIAALVDPTDAVAPLRSLPYRLRGIARAVFKQARTSSEGDWWL
jgi:hypothetical protein